MSRAACAKAIINAALKGKIEEWKEVEDGIVAVLDSPSFRSLPDRRQEKLIAPLIDADQAAIAAISGLTERYETASEEILKAI